MSNVIFEAPNGARTPMSAEDAMKAHAAANFKGRILTEDTANRTTEDVLANNVAAEAAMNGLALPPTWFAAGTEMIQAGKDKFVTLAKEHADLPLFEDVAEAVAKQIDQEDRDDVTIDISKLTMNERGQISRDGERWIGIEPQAFDQLIAKAHDVFPMGRQLMLAMDVDQRAEVFNRQIAKLEKLLPEDLRIAKARLRTVNGKRQNFALVGKGFPSADANKVLRMAASKLKGSGARGEVAYNPGKVTTTARFTWSAPETYDAKVGDVFRGGGVMTTNDSGRGKFRCNAAVTRIICINCTIADIEAEIGERIHRGGIDAFLADVGKAVEATKEGFRDLLDNWGVLRETPVKGYKLGNMEFETSEEMLAGLVEKGYLGKDIARDVLAEMVLRNFAEEPGDTLADVINAITRSAHDAAVEVDDRVFLEKAAGRLSMTMAMA
jgi:hypothetical protein